MQQRNVSQCTLCSYTDRFGKKKNVSFILRFYRTHSLGPREISCVTTKQIPHHLLIFEFEKKKRFFWAPPTFSGMMCIGVEHLE